MTTTEHPLYTRAFWTAWIIHFTGAMSHAMFVLFPLYVLHLGGDALLIGLLLGISLASLYRKLSLAPDGSPPAAEEA